MADPRWIIRPDFIIQALNVAVINNLKAFMRSFGTKSELEKIGPWDYIRHALLKMNYGKAGPCAVGNIQLTLGLCVR